MGVRSIPTTYKGVRFASSLEADWAKTLDGLRIVWQYEPEGLVLPGGAWYRCDFYLPRVSTWLEVKGPHNQGISKPGGLADALVHVDGCRRGRPVSVMVRPDGAPAPGCVCGFGPDFPYRLVVVGRPATSGKMTFEAPRMSGGGSARLAVLQCPACWQFSFTDVNGAPVCRRCHSLAEGAPCSLSGRLPFRRVSVPVRGRRRGGDAA